MRSAGVLDMDQVGRVLVRLAADEEYLGPLIAEMPSESPGGKWLVKPERGPRLVLFHRPEGVMAYTHSHHCWVAIAPVRGVETHQRWDAVTLGAAGPNCAWPMTAPCTAVTSRPSPRRRRPR